MNRFLVSIAAAILALASSASAHEGTLHEGCDPGTTFTAGDLTISGAFTRHMLPGARSAGGYLTIVNAGAAPDRLISGTTEAARLVQFHDMKMVGDVMKMSELPEGIEIPVGATVSLTPGGLHMMFLAIRTPFKEGECVALTLEFAKAGPVDVVLAVGDAAADGPPEHAH